MVQTTGQFHGFSVELDKKGVALLTLERPERKNGLTLTMKRELMEWMVHASTENAIRIIVIAGRGDSFSAGDDISGKAGDDMTEPVFAEPLALGPRNSIRTYNALRLGSQTLSGMLLKMDKPMIAAVNGVAIQSGLTLALCCDFRIAARTARLGSGTLRFALTPDDGGHYLLVKMLGLPGALDFVLRNRIVDAQRALELGLVSEVAEPEEVLPKALQLAQEMAEMPQVVLRMVKRSLYVASEATYAQAMEDIAIRTIMTDYHEDAHEGIDAFREKRKPRYNAWMDDK
jgi:enoyl-CoA hydratase/carnithine racemase